VNRRAPIIAGVISAALALLAVLLLVLPKMSDVSTTEEELQSAEDQEVALAAQLDALQEAEAAAPKTEQEIGAIEEQVPPTANLPSLFRLLQGAADRSAVDFFSFSPGTPAPNAGGTYSSIASQVTVSGGYFAIDEFLFLLETLPRAAKVTTLAVTPSGAATGGTTISTSNLQLQVTVEFYTTDVSAGPGSIPGPSETTGTGA
jgi:Tfp pilus assembly protein PilO